MSMAEEKKAYTIRVYGYFELTYQDAENVDMARGQAKQQILDSIRDPQGRPLFNVEKVEA